MKAMELTFSTIAMLVGVMVVLLVVLVFFRGGFEGPGAKFGLVGKEARKGVESETGEGGGLNIGDVLGGIKSGFCSKNEDCASLGTDFKCLDSWRCKATRPYRTGDNQANDCYYVIKKENGWGPYYPTQGQCQSDCANACGQPECTKSSKRCMVGA